MTDERISHTKIGNALSDHLAYPETWMRTVYRAPLLFWRLGFGPAMGRIVLILSHIGRRTGKIRRTALEYHRHEGRIYVFSGWSRSDWFKNIQAEPRVTVQTEQGTLHALARVLESDSEFIQAHGLIQNNWMVRSELNMLGIDTSLAGFVANKDNLHIVTFDPTSEPTPPPLQADLIWVTPLALGSFGLGYLAGKQDARPKRRWF